MHRKSFLKIRDEYRVCSTSSIVSGRRTFLVSGRREAESPAVKDVKMKTALGRGSHTSSRSMIRGDRDTPKRAIKEQ